MPDESRDGLKATLRVVLYAGETEVVESLDEGVWQETFARIRGHFLPAKSRLDKVEHPSHSETQIGNNDYDQAIVRWASAMGVSPEEVEGACSPSRETPFLHLNAHNWESLKKNT